MSPISVIPRNPSISTRRCSPWCHVNRPFLCPSLLVIRSLQKEVARSCQQAAMECKKELGDMNAAITSRDVESVVGTPK